MSQWHKKTETYLKLKSDKQIYFKSINIKFWKDLFFYRFKCRNTLLLKHRLLWKLLLMSQWHIKQKSYHYGFCYYHRRFLFLLTKLTVQICVTSCYNNHVKCLDVKIWMSQWHKKNNHYFHSTLYKIFSLHVLFVLKIV